MCVAFLFEEDPQSALTYIQKARILGSRAQDISLWEAVAYERLNKIDLAKEAYDEASKSMRSDLRPWVMSGLMLAKAGRCTEAKPLLINAAKRGGAKAPALQQALRLCAP